MVLLDATYRLFWACGNYILPYGECCVKVKILVITDFFVDRLEADSTTSDNYYFFIGNSQALSLGGDKIKPPRLLTV